VPPSSANLNGTHKYSATICADLSHRIAPTSENKCVDTD
jgi:hypothetical protein